MNKKDDQLTGYYKEQAAREKKYNRYIRRQTIKEIWVRQTILFFFYCSLAYIFWEIGLYSWINENILADSIKMNFPCAIGGMIVVWIADTIFTYRKSYRDNDYFNRPFFTSFEDTRIKFRWDDD